MNSQLVIRWAAFGSLAVAILAAIGCTPGRSDVDGRVTYQGKPVVCGFVTVIGGDGMFRNAEIGPDGTFRATNLVLGTATFAVMSPDPSKTKYETSVDRSKWVPLPDVFSDPRKSGITTDLQPGPNRFDIELK